MLLFALIFATVILKQPLNTEIQKQKINSFYDFYSSNFPFIGKQSKRQIFLVTEEVYARDRSKTNEAKNGF